MSTTDIPADGTPSPAARPVSPAAVTTTPQPPATAETTPAAKPAEQMPGEIGGPNGPEPTRYGDWEFKGRCSDF